MANRIIKDAKDAKSNELIYFRGHAKATYMSDGRTVEDAINSAGTGVGSTADMSNYYTKAQIDAKGYITSVPSEYVTETELNAKGYLTEHQDISGKHDKLVSGTNVKTVNGTSILGGGNISTYRPLQTSTSTSMTLTPNVYHRNTSTSLASLTITLGTATDNTILNEYFVEFTTRSAGTTINLPSGIKWFNGETPTFEASTTYQISIINNLGVVAKFK